MDDNQNEPSKLITSCIEYGLIASLIVVAVVGVLLTLGPSLSTVYENLHSLLQSQAQHVQDILEAN